MNPGEDSDTGSDPSREVAAVILHTDDIIAELRTISDMTAWFSTKRNWNSALNMCSWWTAEMRFRELLSGQSQKDGQSCR